jgi:hypothetical protein
MMKQKTTKMRDVVGALEYQKLQEQYLANPQGIATEQNRPRSSAQ